MLAVAIGACERLFPIGWFLFHFPMRGFALSAKVVSLVQVVRKLHGSSRPLLVLADDGNFYVTKLQRTASEPRMLFNEAAGSILYNAAGLPVPRWRIIRVPRRIIEQDEMAACGVTTDESGEPSGFAFASSLVIGRPGLPFDVLPSSYISRLRDRELFWLAWLIDSCGFHSDNRQAVFTASPDGRIDTTFIDHGRMFGGLTGFDKPKVEASRYLDARLYPDFTAATLEMIRRQLLELNVDQCLDQIATKASNWATSDALTDFRATVSRLSEPKIWENILHVMVSNLDRRNSEHVLRSVKLRSTSNRRVLHS